MSIANILREIKTLKESIEKVRTNLKILQEQTEKNMERHLAIIIAGIKTGNNISFKNSRTNEIFERRGEVPQEKLIQQKQKPEGKFDISDIS